MSLGDKEVQENVTSIFKRTLKMGQNFHYEVTNRYLMIAFTEVIKYHSVTGKKAKNDILAFHLHESLKQIMDFKL
jgi:hypothetical protein